MIKIIRECDSYYAPKENLEIPRCLYCDNPTMNEDRACSENCAEALYGVITSSGSSEPKHFKQEKRVFSLTQ